jgi:DNA polymerase III delta subunit
LAAVADLLAAYLIIGTDRPKVTRALRRLRDRVGEAATEHLSAHDASGEDVAAACNALGLFTVERRLVIVDSVERWKADDVKAVGEYLKRPAPTTVLTLVGDEVKRDSALAKAVAKAGEVLIYDLPTKGRGSKADLPKWVEQQFKERGVQVDRDAARALVELVGENADEILTEVDKLTTWAAGEAIHEREISSRHGRRSRRSTSPTRGADATSLPCSKRASGWSSAPVTHHATCCFARPACSRTTSPASGSARPSTRKACRPRPEPNA